VVPTLLGRRLLSLYRHHFGAFVHAAFVIVHPHSAGISIVRFIGCSKWSPINSQSTASRLVVNQPPARSSHWSDRRRPGLLLAQNPATRITRKWSRLSSSFGPSIVLD
jgi:hypothetical protein